MKTLRLALVAALCLALGALPASGQIVPAPSSASPVVTLGSYSQVGTTGILQLSAYISGAGIRWSTLRLGGASTGYQVTAGKTLIIFAIDYASNIASVALSFGYGDTDIGQGGAAAPTNPVYFTGGNVVSVLTPFETTTAYTRYTAPTFFSVPAGKYPVFTNDTGANSYAVIAYGKEF